MTIAPLAFALFFAAQNVTEVDPLEVFYMADFHPPEPLEPPAPFGRLSARALDPPYHAILTAATTYLNGALALDPVHRVLYGNRCCVRGASIQAHDARTLELLDSKAILLDTSGLVSMELDPLRRVLFVFDAKSVVLFAMSIETETYGAKLAELTLPLNPVATSFTSSDCLAVDGKGARLFITGGNGGSVLSIDISTLSPSGGSFGPVDTLAQTARVADGGGGSLAIDEEGRRVFVIPAHGVVRSFAADPPYRTIEDITVPRMSFNHCGLFFDARNETLYVGRELYQGNSERPVGIDKDGAQVEIEPTEFDGSDVTIYGTSFAGPTGPFAERNGGQTPMHDPIGVREDRVECTCTRARETRVWSSAVLFIAVVASALRRRAKKAGL